MHLPILTNRGNCSYVCVAGHPWTLSTLQRNFCWGSLNGLLTYCVTSSSRYFGHESFYRENKRVTMYVFRIGAITIWSWDLCGSCHRYNSLALIGHSDTYHPPWSRLISGLCHSVMNMKFRYKRISEYIRIGKNNTNEYLNKFV